MKKKPEVDLGKIADTVGGERKGYVRAGAGHFGAVWLVAEVQTRFRAPSSGGRSTDPAWTERRLVPLAPSTLDRLERLAQQMTEEGVTVAPLQIAALLLERAVADVDTSFRSGNGR